MYGSIPSGTATSDTQTLFGQTMELVALTAALFALGAYLGRDLSGGWGLVFFVLSFVTLIAMRSAVRRASPSTVMLLGAFGILIGLGTGSTIAYYASTEPTVVWQAGGATALFVAGLGAIGYATRRDLAPIARLSFWGLVALIAFGVVTIFVNIPHPALVYSIFGLVVFAGLTMVDFQRLRASSDADSAPLIAASIFLDALNVFLFFLNIFDRRSS